MKANSSNALKIARTLLTIGWSVGVLINGIGFTVTYLLLPQLKVLGFPTTIISIALLFTAFTSVLVVPFIIHLYFPNVLFRQSEINQAIEDYNLAIATFSAAKKKLTDQIADNIVSPQLPHINARREYFDKTKSTHTIRVYDEHGTLIADAGEHQPTWDITLVFRGKYILFSPGKTPIAEPSKHCVCIQLPEPN